MPASPDDEERERRIDQLMAEREQLEAEMSKVQDVVTLSARNTRIAEIVAEIKQLIEE